MLGARVHFTCPRCCDFLAAVEQLTIAMSDVFLWLITCPRCGKPTYGKLHPSNGHKVAKLLEHGAQVNYAGVADEAEEWLRERRTT